jgi:hypothetical protein
MKLLGKNFIFLFLEKGQKVLLITSTLTILAYRLIFKIIDDSSIAPLVKYQQAKFSFCQTIICLLLQPNE